MHTEGSLNDKSVTRILTVFRGVNTSALAGIMIPSKLIGEGGDDLSLTV